MHFSVLIYAVKHYLMVLTVFFIQFKILKDYISLIWYVVFELQLLQLKIFVIVHNKNEVEKGPKTNWHYVESYISSDSKL